MERTTSKMLDDQLKSEIQGLVVMEAGSEEKSKATDDVAKLYKLKIEEEAKAEEASAKAKDRKIKIGVETAGILSSLGLTCYWLSKTFKFEETGTIVSKAGQGVLNKLFKIMK